MKLQDLFGKMMGMDSSKDYDIVEVPATQTPPVTEEPAVIPPAEQNSSTVENDQMAEVMKRVETLESRNKVLESANIALLNRTSIQEKPKTTEELIANMCVPDFMKRKEN